MTDDGVVPPAIPDEAADPPTIVVSERPDDRGHATEERCSSRMTAPFSVGVNPNSRNAV